MRIREMSIDDVVMWLVNDDIENISQMLADSDDSYLRDILLGGVRGYLEYTTEMLLEEINCRLAEIPEESKTFDKVIISNEESNHEN